MEYKAIAKYIKISPRKVRLIADAVKELPIDEAIKALEGLNNRASTPLLKTIKSAVANAVDTGNIEKSKLNIKTINITEGVRYKRYHYAGRGRSRPYVKRTSHINVILADNNVQEPNTKAQTKIEIKGKEEK